ncbi:MAG: hypothetical protein WDZ76_03395 [Pseudohongiellaceae bacterium]
MSCIPSPFSYVKTWGTSYLILVVHASSLTASQDLFVNLVALPLLAGLAFGVIKFMMSDFNRSQLELEVDYFGEELVEKVFSYLMTVPLFVTCLVLLIAQLSGSYDQLAWWVLATGLITGGELGALVSNIRENPSA